MTRKRSPAASPRTISASFSAHGVSRTASLIAAQDGSLCGSRPTQPVRLAPDQFADHLRLAEEDAAMKSRSDHLGTDLEHRQKLRKLATLGAQAFGEDVLTG